MDVISLVLFALIAGFVVFAVVVQVLARRPEKRAIAHNGEIVGEDLPDLEDSHGFGLWAQFHDRLP